MSGLAGEEKIAVCVSDLQPGNVFFLFYVTSCVTGSRWGFFKVEVRRSRCELSFLVQVKFDRHETEWPCCLQETRFGSQTMF